MVSRARPSDLLARHFAMEVARLIRDARQQLGWTQQTLADRASVARSTVAAVEGADEGTTLHVVGRTLSALGMKPTLQGGVPLIAPRPTSDAVHAWCIAFVRRRLRAAGWTVLTEVEIADGTLRGWIDVLAFDPSSGRLLVIEVKTVLEDVGGATRQMDRYARLVGPVAERHGWRVEGVASWLLVLATDANDIAIRRHDELLRAAFPVRARSMAELLGTQAAVHPARGIALIDPTHRGRRWLHPASIDARKVLRQPFRGYADAAEHIRVTGR